MLLQEVCIQVNFSYQYYQFKKQIRQNRLHPSSTVEHSSQKKAQKSLGKYINCQNGTPSRSMSNLNSNNTSPSTINAFKQVQTNKIKKAKPIESSVASSDM